MESRFGLSVVELGLVSITIGVAELAGELATTAFVDRLGKRRAVLLGLASVAVVYAALPVLGQRLEWALVGLALLFFTFEFTIVSYLPLISELAPGARATMLSANVAAGTTARMIGSAAGTFLFASLGRLEFNAGLSAAASALGCLLLWRFVQDAGRQPGEAALTLPSSDPQAAE